jgi:hypothetical protein
MRNKEGNVICGVRHFDYLMRAVTGLRVTGWSFVAAEQGFLDNLGQFVSREKAWEVAVKANQIIRPLPGREGILYSENLY